VENDSTKNRWGHLPYRKKKGGEKRGNTAHRALGGVPPPVLGGGGWEVFLFFGFPAGEYPRSVLVEGGILLHV
jgi:hypothetical protein